MVSSTVCLAPPTFLVFGVLGGGVLGWLLLPGEHLRGGEGEDWAGV